VSIHKWSHTALYNGAPLTGVSTTVYLAGTTTLATLYSDAAGTIPLANPFTNDAVFGLITFYAQDGLYDVVPVKTGYSLPTLPNELIGGTDLLSVSLTVTPTAGQPTIVVPNLIVANSRSAGVFVHNDIGLGSSGGLTGYDVGDGTTTDKWSGGHPGGIPLTVDYQSVQGDFGSASEDIYPTATSVILSARGGLFDSVGQVTVTYKYRIDGP